MVVQHNYQTISTNLAFAVSIDSLHSCCAGADKPSALCEQQHTQLLVPALRAVTNNNNAKQFCRRLFHYDPFTCAMECRFCIYYAKQSTVTSMILNSV
jgi:hypothetical protein